MKFVRTQGVVLRYRNRNEADRLLTVLSPDLGRIMVFARGCRKPKSRFLAFSQLFCYGEVIISPYRDIYILNQAEVKNSYYDIRKDMDRLSCATYIVNLAEAVATTGENHTPLFSLLLHTLSYLSYSNRHPLEIALIYELKFLDQAGYRPIVQNRAINRFSVQTETAKVVKAILDSDLVQAWEISIPPLVRQELNKILPAFIEEKLQLQIQTRSFLYLIP